MSKLIGTLSAAALAFALSGFACAADEPQSGAQGQPRADQSQPAQSSDTTSKREQEYMTALKRCESLSASDKQKCIEAAKKKYGEM